MRRAPNASDYQYVEALCELVAANERITITKLSTKIGISRQAIYKKLKRPHFANWVVEQIAATRAFEWELAMLHATSRAARGSISHFRLVARIRALGMR